MAGISKICCGSAATRSIFGTSTLLLLALNAGTADSQNIPNLNATAFNVPPTGAWEGNDGSWATFFIHLGSPSQIARVLPATNWQEVWVISSDACIGQAPEDCADKRGLTVTPNMSTTWQERGQFETDISRDLGYSENGLYFLDSVGLTNQDSGPTVDSQTVVAITSDEFYLGLLGLGDQPTNFTDFNNPQPSFLTSLYNSGIIPSLSWGYQAGCLSRGKSSTPSLVFGGYDTSRYVPNDIIFTQSQNYVNPFLVALHEITAEGVWANGVEGTASLLDSSFKRTNDPAFVSIDSNTAYMWFPNATCAIFESALNLTYSESTGLYLLTEEEHDRLVEQNPTFKFSISDGTANDTKMTVEIPYTSFSLEATGPEILGQEGKSWYFPLKRLPEDGDPRLGRAFMQEVYLFAEYHFKTFRLYQADFGNRDGGIVTHLPVKEVESGSDDGKTPVAAIAGGVAGGAVVLIAIVAAWFLYRRRQKKKNYDPTKDPKYVPEVDGSSKKAHELAGRPTWGAAGGVSATSNTGEKRVVEVEGLHEIDGNGREKTWNEADSTPVNNHFEKEGSPTQYQQYQNYSEMPGQGNYHEMGDGHVYHEMGAGGNYHEMGGGDARAPAHEMPGETRRDGQ